MAPTSTASQSHSDPLLPSKSSTNDPNPLPRTTSVAIKTLSLLRIGLGASCIVAPRLTSAFFQYPIPASAAVLVRFFGVRDLILGELLLSAEDKNAADGQGGRREVKRALTAGMAADAVDACSVLIAMSGGHMGGLAAGLFGGAAVALLGVGAVGLKAV